MKRSLSSKMPVMIVGLNGCTANTFVSGLHSAPVSGLGSILSSDEWSSIPFREPGEFSFFGWDISERDAMTVATEYRIIPEEVLSTCSPTLQSIIPRPAIVGRFDTDETQNSKFTQRAETASHLVERAQSDIAMWQSSCGTNTGIVVYLGPPLRKVSNLLDLSNHPSIASLLNNSTPGEVTSGMIYAIAAAKQGCAFIDFTPNATLDVPAIAEAFPASGLPLAGRDGNTGQSLLKTVLGHMFRIRNLHVDGWYSTNILGNNDGLVLSRPEHAALKIDDKKGILGPVLGYETEHVVTIDYYRPRGDNKESWDNIDFTGWCGGSMSMKVNWLGRDSLLAAPLLWDLVRHLAYSLESGWSGPQTHLSVYFKHPIVRGPEPFFLQYCQLLRAYNLLDTMIQ